MRKITHEQMPVHEGLAQRGISKQEISALADGISADLAYIREMPSYNSEAIFGYFVPGRLEVLGKHTDYAGGSSLVCAVNKGLRIYGLKSDDGLLHIHHLDQKNKLHHRPFRPPRHRARLGSLCANRSTKTNGQFW